MVGIFPPGLGAAGQAIGQTAPMPLPLPVPGLSADPAGGSGADTGLGSGAPTLDRSRSRERPCKCPAAKGTKAPVPYVMSELSAKFLPRVLNRSQYSTA